MGKNNRNKMKTKLVLIILGMFLITLTSASMTSDLFSDNCTQLEITIGQNNSQVDFMFDSEGYWWDELGGIYVEELDVSFSLTNATLSEFLEGLNFKIENKEEQLKFTSIEIIETEKDLTSFILYMLYNSFEEVDYDEFMDYLDNEDLLVGLLNEFIELDNSESYQSFEKSGNHYLYSFNQGHENVDIEEIVNESIQVFYISNILSELGIENIYDLNFSMEVQGLDNLSEGDNILNLIVIDGDKTYEKDIILNLNGYEEIEDPVEEIVEEPKKSSGSSHSHKKTIKEEVKYKLIKTLTYEELRNGFNLRIRSGEFIKFRIYEDHNLSVLNVGETNALIRVQSEPQTFSLNVGEERILTIGDDEIISVKLNSISDNYADLEVKRVMDGSEVVGDDEILLDITNELDKKIKERNYYGLIFLGGCCLL